MNFDTIRSRFINHYQELGYQLLRPAPLLHPSIPMSYVMSAGLVQIETALAQKKINKGDKYMLVQKCFRHFDLHKVGTDDTHLSLFEMPGAFIFDQNGKEKAIKAMWELATERLGIDKNLIWATYFRGDHYQGQMLEKDEMTYNTWVELRLPETKMVALGLADNYWIQGGGASLNGNGDAVRKCGPNTELFYERKEKQPCSRSCLPGCKCGRFVEFSNSLFITHKFDLYSNAVVPLAEPFFETVIGTERVAMILQKTDSVFATEDYLAAINQIRSFVVRNDLSIDMLIASERLIVDHLRALIELVSDGAPAPGKNGRHRIVKLLIRGVLTRQILLGINSDAFLHSMLQLLFETKLISSSESNKIEFDTINKIIEYFSIESLRFHKTIERGLKELESMLNNNKAATLSGSQIFHLEKKWGIPHLVTAMVLEMKNLSYAGVEYKRELDSWQTS